MKQYLTAEQVAEMMGLSPETLAQWRSQGRGLPYLKIERAVRYDPADVQAYLEGCRVLSPFRKEGDGIERFQKTR